MTSLVNSSENRMPPPGAKIAVAMSGGVDSAAAAMLLVQAGYDCLGITLNMSDSASDEDKTIKDARHICKILSIPHTRCDVNHAFETFIVDRFVDDYLSGLTPNPCIRCNRMIKFGVLLKEAQELGCTYLATGHYVRLLEKERRFALCRAGYPDKDQSYVLAPLTQKQLKYCCFPLGIYSKAEARQFASTVDPAIGAKKDSQEICFIENNCYADFLESRGQGRNPGPIKALDGKVLGRHDGIHRYTIGQRHGLGLSAPRPLYVIHLDADTNTVYVGGAESGLCSMFTTDPLFWGAMSPQNEAFRALVQIRYRHRPVPCWVTPTSKGAEIRPDEAQAAVTPGQWAVFYDQQDCIVASGAIQRGAALRGTEM
ncbi:MAG: tRNA 2-thiouridine(34) synthase MnmA [Candidatus Hydrogenedentales bacterium]